MTAADLVSRVKSFPPVSHAALKLVNLLEQPAIGNSEVVETLKCDNVLTAKLLRACNSPYFGLEQSVASVDQAVLILGHQQILHIVLMLAFGTAMTVPMPAYAAEACELWRHSLVTAAAAEILSTEINSLNFETPVVFTAGLLHDIGKLVVGQTLTMDLHNELHAFMDKDGLTRVEAERRILGIDHAEIGACLLQNWHVPDEIVESVANHHHPQLEPTLRLSAVACLSNALAHAANPLPVQNAHAVGVDDKVLNALGISPEQFDALVVPVRESLERVQHLMTMG